MSIEIRNSIQTSIWISVLLLFGNGIVLAAETNSDIQTIHARYIPLADHYAALVVYEPYREHMNHADFKVEQMKNRDLLRAYFQSGKIDIHEFSNTRFNIN